MCVRELAGRSVLMSFYESTYSFYESTKCFFKVNLPVFQCQDWEKQEAASVAGLTADSPKELNAPGGGPVAGWI